MTIQEDCLSLNIKALLSFEMLVHIYQSTRHNIPEDHCEKFKSRDDETIVLVMSIRMPVKVNWLLDIKHRSTVVTGKFIQINWIHYVNVCVYWLVSVV